MHSVYLSLSLWMFFNLLSHTSSCCYFIPFFQCSMYCSFLIRFRHFFSLAISCPSGSVLLFLFRFIGVIWHYHLWLPGCVSLNAEDTKPLVIAVLALWRTFVIKMFYCRWWSCMIFFKCGCCDEHLNYKQSCDTQLKKSSKNTFPDESVHFR